MTAGCPHGFPKPENCWTCMEDGNIALPPPPPQVEREGPVIAARFDTQCRACNTGIHVGQPIVRTTHGTYVHERCAP